MAKSANTIAGGLALFAAVIAAWRARRLAARPHPSRARTTARRGHDAPEDVPPALTAEEQAVMGKFEADQEAAPRPSVAGAASDTSISEPHSPLVVEECRTLVEQSIGFGVLSTNSVQHPGFPTGSVVGFSLDARGLPFFSLSTLSAHTTDANADGRVSLTVMASDFKGAAEGRVVLIGNIVKVSDKEESDRLRELYLSRHKDAFWVKFGDFSLYKMSAMKHMNEDHADSIAAIVKRCTGIPCSEAKISAMDRLGMTVSARLELGGTRKVRLTFPRPVDERRAIKQVLVEMTNASS